MLRWLLFLARRRRCRREGCVPFADSTVFYRSDGVDVVTLCRRCGQPMVLAESHGRKFPRPRLT